MKKDYTKFKKNEEVGVNFNPLHPQGDILNECENDYHPVDDEPTTKGFEKHYFVDYCKYLNLRRQPDVKSKVICVLKEGDKLKIKEENEEWCKVEMYTRVNSETNKENIFVDGYVKSAFIRVEIIEK